MEPVTSQNTTVTDLRTSWRVASSSGDAHAMQNRASSGFSTPQLGQARMTASLASPLTPPADGHADVVLLGFFGFGCFGGSEDANATPRSTHA